MTSDTPGWQTARAGAVADSRGWRRRERAGRRRRRVPVLEFLESRRLLTAGGSSQGVATGAGPDRNIWFTLSANDIGMINPGNPYAGVTRYSKVVTATRQSLSAPTAGILLDYNWLLGRSERFLVGTGIGAKRILASESERQRVRLDYATVTTRLILGFAF